MSYQMKGIDIPEWSTIKGYFTVVEQQHMLQVTNGDLDLFDCKSVRTYASQIYQQVSTGKMPPGGPRWTGEMVNNFFTWWKQGTCPA